MLKKQETEKNIEKISNLSGELEINGNEREQDDSIR